MKITKLILENFRSFKDLEISFDPQLTVIVGVNGAGKTSVLDGIALLLGRFLSRLPKVEGIGISPHDLHIKANGRLAPALRCYAEVSIATELQHLPSPVNHDDQLDGTLSWSRSLSRDKSPRTKIEVSKEMRQDTRAGWKEIDRFADQLTDADNNGAAYQMPVFAYYGTDRAIFSTPLRRRNFATTFPRFDSLSGALKPSANFKRVFEWMHAKENQELREQRNKNQNNYRDPELEVVRKAIEAFFPQFKNPRTELAPLRFVVDAKVTDDSQQRMSYDLKQLSDGYRTCLALVADLACRMAEANPPSVSTVLSSPLEAEALVLIDEVDLHLHPGWQQHILLDLRRVFPNTQFIVSTHSPQVLTTVAPSTIRILKDGNVETVNFSEGAQSQVALERILGVQPRPALVAVVKKLTRYHELVNNDQWDIPEALTLRQDLNEWGHGQEPELVKIDMDIRLREWRRANTSSMAS